MRSAMTDKEIKAMDIEKSQGVLDNLTNSGAVEDKDTKADAEGILAAEEAAQEKEAESTLPVKSTEQHIEAKEADSKSTQKTKEVKVDELPTLPDAYRRAAIHQEWKDEDVDRLYKASPEDALKTFAKIYETSNNLSVQFSELGQIKAQQEAQIRVNAEEAAKVVAQPAKPSPINIDKLRDTYGNDPIVDVVRQLTETISELQATKPDVTVQPRIVAPVYQPKAADYSGEARLINDFFVSDPLKAYEGFYGAKVGSEWERLSPGEFENRRAVVQLASDIVAGASLKGTPMSDDIALEKAHMVISRPYLERTIVAGINETLSKRSASLTLKPVTSAGAHDIDTKAKPQNRTEVVSRAAERLDAFNRKNF